MTESDRDEAANTLISCIAAVFKQLKARDPAAYPWVGNMLGTEHIRQMGTSVFIHLNDRRGDGSPSNPSFVAPAAQTALDTSKPVRKRPRALTGPTIECPGCGETKPWRMSWPAGPMSVCIDCYKAGRTA